MSEIADGKAAGCWVCGEMVSEVGEDSMEEGFAGMVIRTPKTYLNANSHLTSVYRLSSIN